MPNITILDKNQPAPLPFLPGTNIQYAWDSTSLGYFKTCPRLYQYIMIEGWGSNEESIHLRFGIEYHSALEEFDHLRADGVDYDAAVFQTVRSLLIRTFGWAPDPETKAGKYKNRLSLVRTVINYLDRFRMDGIKTYILSNGQPAVELSFRFELDFGPKCSGGAKVTENWPGPTYKVEEIPSQPYLLCGHLDRVVDYADAIFAMDRKTSLYTIGSHWFDQFDVSNQMTLYSLAAKVILEAPIKGVIIDAAQILIESNEFARGITYRTPDRLEEWVNDLKVHLRNAETYATEGYWPQNDTSCDKFGGCQFREVCSKSPQVRESWLKGKFVKREIEERWNPLKPR